ncbi:universal stress protein [uncultured Kordia sp.]|uniref:universal stress protein n=1 Tax=uncultured Kordia sp. TaxID=507699 RepID=UPI0026323A31|nr:universal stress protein [uncultured Kordia sp.]
MKNVLILTDFSTCAQNAIHYALHFLKDEACCFYIMHVHKSGSFTMDDLMASATANVYESVFKAENDRLEKLIDSLEQTSENDAHKFYSILDYDSFLQAIYRIIEEKKIDILVAGYNGVSNVEEIVFGSHTLSIVRKINCKTLVVPENATFHNPKTMLLLLDAKDDIQGKAFENLIHTAKNHDMHVHVLRVYEKGYKGDRYDESYLMKHCKDVNYTYHVIENVPLDYVKSCYMQLYDIDMIGLIVQKESVFERLFKHSTTTTISKTLKKPLLVTHP